LTVFGWVSWLIARAYRRKRETRSLRFASLGCRIFTPTMRFIWG